MSHYTTSSWSRLCGPASRQQPSPRGTSGQRVRCVLCDDKLMLTMMCISDLSVFKSQDGTCILSSQLAKTKLRPANANTEGESLQNIWIWKRLCILDAGEVRTMSIGYISYVHRHSFLSYVYTRRSQRCYLLVLPSIRLRHRPSQMWTMTARSFAPA